MLAAVVVDIIRTGALGPGILPGFVCSSLFNFPARRIVFTNLSLLLREWLLELLLELLLEGVLLNRLLLELVINTGWAHAFLELLPPGAWL